MIGQAHILGLLVLPKCVGSLLCVLWMCYQDYPLRQVPSVHLARGSNFALYKQRGFPELFLPPSSSSSPAVFFFFFFNLTFQCVIAYGLSCDLRSGYSTKCVFACDFICDISLIHNSLMYYKLPLITE